MPIPEGFRWRSWVVRIDGQEYWADLVEIKSRYGTLTYGVRPEGYDGWAFAQEGGGGSVTIPYTRTPGGTLLVGLIFEDRPNLGGKQWCAIGGFKDPGETHADAGLREFFEEVGVDPNEFAPRPLAGMPAVPDRLFWQADPDEGEGNHFYAVRIPFELLQQYTDGNYGFSENVPLEARKTIIAKGEGCVRFMPVNTAIQKTPDCIAGMGIARLLADITET